MSGECNRLADLPLNARRRRINKCCGAPCLDRDVFDVRRSMIVGDFKLYVVEIRLCVLVGGLRGRGITESSVAVQVPGLRQGIAGVWIA